MDQYHFLFKFIIVGDANVGKSCIMLSYIGKEFRNEYEETIGVEFSSKICQQKDATFKIQIWDTAGQEQFRSITRSYYKGSIGVLLVFDITNMESFKNISKWQNEIQKNITVNATIILVGNKLDLNAQRQVTKLEAQAFANEHKMIYIETSAKNRENIEAVFETCALDIFEKINTNIIDITENVGSIKMGPLCNKEAVQQSQQQVQQVQKEQQKDN